MHCPSSLFNLPDPPYPLHTPPRFGGHESTNGTYGEEDFGEDWGLKAYFYFWWAALTGQVETNFKTKHKISQADRFNRAWAAFMEEWDRGY